MALKLNSSSGGSVTLQEPTTASNYTLTVPAQTATLAINGPAFSAYRNSSIQSISPTTWTKVEFNAENFDTASCFDTTTYRFTPNVAGYYQVNATINTNYATAKRVLLAFYKNGSTYLVAVDLDSPSLSSQSFNEVTGSALVYMNGSTDYLEVYGYINGTAGGGVLGFYYGSTFTQFSGYLARAA